MAARTLGDEVWEALGGTAAQHVTLGVVNLYRGRVVNPPADEEGNVHAYAVLFDSPGRRSGSRVGAVRDQFDGTFQVTCAGGDPTKALWCVDMVAARLTGTRIAVPGRTRQVRIVEDESNRSRSLVRDETVSPARYFVPLLFNIRA